jgi:hypothetical protein
MPCLTQATLEAEGNKVNNALLSEHNIIKGTPWPILLQSLGV